MKYRSEIDGLRALAVTPVVLFHAGLPGVPGGYFGVDVFFVISGFLITSIIDDEVRGGRFSLVAFYERRARRILPALAVVLALTLVAGWVVQTPGAFRATADSVVATVFFLSNVHFWRSTDYFAAAADYRILLHTWSLAVEEQFYLVWPLVLMVFARFGFAGFSRAALALFALSLTLSILATPHFPSASFYLPVTRAWELMTGALLALGAVPPIRSARLGQAVAAGGLAMIVAAIALVDDTADVPGAIAMLPCLGAACIIHAGRATVVGSLLSLRPVVFVGLVSYSFYLWHWPPLAIARIVQGSVGIGPGLAAALVAGAFLAAVLSYRFVERPFRDRRAVPRRAVFALSLCSLAALCATGLFTRAADGFPGRFPAEALAADRDARGSQDGPSCAGGLSQEGLCRIGDLRREPTVLLWGDSHAGAARAGVDAALGTLGIAGVAASHNGCLPLPDARRAHGHQSCTRFTDAVIDLLAAPRSRIDTVILMGRWALNVTGERAPGEAGAPVRLVSRDGTAAGASNAALVRRGLEALVDRLRESGARVVLVGGVPEIGWNVPERLLMQARLALPDLAAPTLADVAARNREADAILVRLAERDGVDHIPLAPMLCRPDCAVTRDGRPLYRDDDHLSRHGAVSVLGPYLRARIWPAAAADAEARGSVMAARP